MYEAKSLMVVYFRHSNMTLNYTSVTLPPDYVAPGLTAESKLIEDCFLLL